MDLGRQKRGLPCDNQHNRAPYVDSLISEAKIGFILDLADSNEKIENYITDIVFSTRYPKDFKLERFSNMISFGASPRASINLALAAKAYAFIKRRGYVIPEDVRAIAHAVMRHRIGLTYEAEAENITTDDIVNEILNTVEVP